MPTTRDPVGVALASLGAGSSTGAAVITAGMIVLRTVQTRQDLGAGEVGAGFAVVWASLFLGIAAAVASGWTLAMTLSDTWRRAVIGMLSVFGTALLAGIAVPADLLAGRAGLLLYLAGLLALSAFSRRAARRAAKT